MEYEMISSSTMTVFVLMTLIGITVPVFLALFWKLRTKQPIIIVLVGAITFFVSAIVLESIPKLVLLQPTNPIGLFIVSSPILSTIIAALLAGVFEETGRLVAYKFILKKYDDKKTAISYGIGHGGFEAMYVLTLSGIQYMAYALIINEGEFGTIVSQVAATAPEQVEAIKALPASIAATGYPMLIISVMERFSAILIHIACSIIVFKAVKEKDKMWLYPVAIVLHAVIDLIAAAYQMGLITNILIVELCIMIYAVALFIFCMKKIYWGTETD